MTAAPSTDTWPASGRSFHVPDDVSFTRPLGRRVRGAIAGRFRIDTEDAQLVWKTGSLPHYAFPAEAIAESTRTKALHETGLPARYYFPSADVRLDLLDHSPTATECPYKGTASHYSMAIERRAG